MFAFPLVSRPSRRMVGRLALIAFALNATALSAQVTQAGSADPVKGKVLGPDDYTRWRSIGGQQISGDGNWVTYTLSYTNVPTAQARPELHLVRLDPERDTVLPNASGAVFSPDSKWLAYQVDPSSGGRGAGRGGRGGAGDTVATPPAGTGGAGGAGAAQGRGGQGPAAPATPRRFELRNLASGEIKTWQNVQSFSFSPNSKTLMLRIRAPGAAAAAPAAGGRGAGGGGGGAPAPATPAPAGPRGGDIILVDIATNRPHDYMHFVLDASFDKKGDLLVYTLDSPIREENGIYVKNLVTRTSTTLDQDAKSYSRVTWTEDGAGLAVLKSTDVERMRERNSVVVVIPNVNPPAGVSRINSITIDPAAVPGFPKGYVLSDRGALTWSDDNKRIFFSIKDQQPVADTSRRRGPDEVADVDVWNTSDERIQSVQMTRAEADRNFMFRGAFDVSASRYVKLTDSTMRDIEIAPDGRWAVGRDTRGYIHDYKRPAADFYRVNTSTGERTLMFKGQLTGGHVFGIAPNGNTFLYWKENKFQAYNLDSATTRTLGGATAPSFVNMEYDHPGPRPSYGVTGHSSDAKSVIVNHRYDLWVMPLDGTAPRNLTNGFGTKNEIRFRYVRIGNDSAEAGPGAPPAPGAPAAPAQGGGGGGGAGARGIDLSKPINLTAYGEYTKKAGFFELNNGVLKEILYEDASFSNPTKAANADKYLYTRQTFVEFPDLRVSGTGFKDSKKITNANPQQSEYLWGKRQLIEYKTKAGIRAQAVLTLPDDYKPGEKRPMIVNFYEKNSQNLHRYSAPSLLTGMGSMPIEATTRGYITLMPDVYFTIGRSHSDMLECVEAAVLAAIKKGYVDEKKIGINGHSYGGEGAAFIGTRSKLFAAVAMGAGVTDLFTDFSQQWGWDYGITGGSGANGNDYYLFGQGRWGFSPWDKPEVYHYESALTHVPAVTAPFLIMHGTSDPTVGFQEGLNFYNALRYNEKKATLLAYVGEGHGLRGLGNRKDLTIRYFQFFDHYLKGAPAPKWLTEGVAYLDKETNREPK